MRRVKLVRGCSRLSTAIKEFKNSKEMEKVINHNL